MPRFYSLAVLPLRLSPLTEDTSMITVSSCDVKLQEVLSGLEKKLDIHMHFCGFSQHSLLSLLYFFSFHLGCNYLFSLQIKMSLKMKPSLQTFYSRLYIVLVMHLGFTRSMLCILNGVHTRKCTMGFIP